MKKDRIEICSTGRKLRYLLLLSACLAGKNCKYNGGNNLAESIKKIYDSGKGILVCPEQMGGLSTPRMPSEIQWVEDKSNGIYLKRVTRQDGKNVTEQYEAGARKAMKICAANECASAILKAKSPSCGSGKVYDGTFSHRLTEGYGIMAEELLKNGVIVFTEKEYAEGKIRTDVIRDRLTAMVTQDEWNKLENTEDTDLIISRFNRETLLQMKVASAYSGSNIEAKTEEEFIPTDLVLEMTDLLNDYLNKYMAEQSQGHKWVLISSLYRRITGLPFHPQSVCGWREEESGGCKQYLCPARENVIGSICQYCVCRSTISITRKDRK